MRKSPQEKGFIIPVKRRLSNGRYQKGWAKSLEPDERNNIVICYDNGKRSTWSINVTIHEPLGFDPIATVCYECGSETEHHIHCSKAEN